METALDNSIADADLCRILADFYRQRLSCMTFTPKTLLRVSVVVALVTILLKGLAGYVTNSMGLISDAMESFVNLASAMFALGMVTIASRPADEDHPYGHHKAEYFSSGFEGILIVGAAAAILWVSVQRLLAPQPLEQLGWGSDSRWSARASTRPWLLRCSAPRGRTARLRSKPMRGT